MTGVTSLLRVWIFVGALLLLVSYPRGPRGQGVTLGGGTQDAAAPMGEPGDCIQPVAVQGQCPSGCTVTKFNQYTTQGGTNGTFYLLDNGPAPCGKAEQGESCNPPLQYYPVGDFSDCCAALGDDCTGVGHNYMNCCDSSDSCMMGTCCIPTGGDGCQGDDNACCDGNCVGNTCQSSGGGGGGCGSDDDCPPDRCCNLETGDCTNCSQVVGAPQSLDRMSSPSRLGSATAGGASNDPSTPPSSSVKSQPPHTRGLR